MFTSKDFPKVPKNLTPQLPEDMNSLIHRQVRKTGVDKDFSAERRHPIAMADLPSTRYSVTFSGITPKSQGRKHRHTYHAISIITKGKGYVEIEGHKIDYEEGDIFEVPVWAWHQLHNPHDEPVEYLTFENAPELLNIGTALREEEA
ncbi:gentisate 1,2-dioxygenase [Candidatus Scalindua japonica]|uniref:Gentisate 1,2-dioxygenase n=1 Tax=Candidatus Scalindua japonica TaxID=1284222 RepID=A0A286U334_9BACT|nr:cupin domain-containing protein [Candidatus Scalindua japonica]GAX62535.1 gentisate 1,2-dioxygenase [Candidatus Scalindua japonica]